MSLGNLMQNVRVRRRISQ